MKILYVTPKEDIKMSYPDEFDFFMKRIFKFIKLKTVKRERTRGAKATNIIYDEYSNFSGGLNLDKNNNIIPANKKCLKKYCKSKKIGYEPLVITETSINRPIEHLFNSPNTKE